MKKVVVKRVCNFCAEEKTAEGEPVLFAVGDENYTADVCEEHRALFQRSIKRWTRKAHHRHSTKRRRRPLRIGVSNEMIRQWAKVNGFSVAHKGPVPREVVLAYKKANTNVRTAA